MPPTTNTFVILGGEYSRGPGKGGEPPRPCNLGGAGARGLPPAIFPFAPDDVSFSTLPLSKRGAGGIFRYVLSSLSCSPALLLSCSGVFARGDFPVSVISSFGGLNLGGADDSHRLHELYILRSSAKGMLASGFSLNHFSLFPQTTGHRSVFVFSLHSCTLERTSNP